MKYLICLCMLSGCLGREQPSNAIEELGEKVISSKEGIDIRLTPVDRETNKK